MKKMILPLLFLSLLFLLSSCEKRRVRNRLDGTWLVKNYSRDTSNMLIRRDSVTVFSNQCDSFRTPYRRNYEYFFNFTKDGKVSRRMLANHYFTNASLLDAACNPSYTSVDYDSIIQGKWEYAEGGNLAFQFPGMVDNLIIKFNDDREMTWEQVLQIDTGIVKFTGIENWLLIKQ